MKKITLLLSLITFLAISGFFLTTKVEANSNDNVSGFAWSENIGWISFNDLNCDVNENGTYEGMYEGAPAGCPSSGTVNPYGVNVDLGTGLFSGYAWSEHIGWITFNSGELVGCPDGSCLAQLDIATNEVSGWARALAYGDGWDGWIKLRETGYGVWLDTSVNEFRDWAWSGDDVDEEAVIGWISFNCSNQGVCGTSDYKVFIAGPVNLPPSATSLNITSPPDYCFVSSPPIFLNWTYSDPDDDPQSAYQVQVDNNPDFSSPEVDSGKVISASTDYSPPGLSFSTTYFWRVMVWDSVDTPSIFMSGLSFSTLSRPPWPDFTWSPLEPAAGEIIQFTDQTTFYGTSPGWEWDFDGDGGTDSIEQNPTHSYSVSGDYIVELIAVDSDGSCSLQQTLTTGSPLPEWREIAPIGWLKKLFASLFSFFRA